MRGRRSGATRHGESKLVPGSKQEDVKRGKPRQAQDQLIIRYLGVSVAGCAPDGAAAPGQEPICPSTNPACLSFPEVRPKTLARQRSAKSALSALVTWERRWPQTSWPPDDGCSHTSAARIRSTSLRRSVSG